MGRQKHRRMINIQNLNGLGGSDSSKWQKTTTSRNSDLEVTIGKENVRFYLPITDFLPYLDSGNPWHGTRKPPYEKNAINLPMHHWKRLHNSKIGPTFEKQKLSVLLQERLVDHTEVDCDCLEVDLWPTCGRVLSKWTWSLINDQTPFLRNKSSHGALICTKFWHFIRNTF
jgi:hypothetical protein